MHAPLLQAIAVALDVLLLPLLAALCAALLYAVYETGRLAMAGWQRRGRHPGEARQDLRCFTLLHWAACNPAASGNTWDSAARSLAEWPRLMIVIGPGLGAVCSLILSWTGAGAAAGTRAGAAVGAEAVAGAASAFGAFAPPALAQPYLAGAALAPLAAGLLTGMLALVVATIRRRWLDEELAWLHARAAQQGEREARLAGQLAQACSAVQ